MELDASDGSNEAAQFFVKLWARATAYWRDGAGPRCAMTLPDGREFSDRWQQSLVMKRLAEQAWGLSEAT